MKFLILVCISICMSCAVLALPIQTQDNGGSAGSSISAGTTHVYVNQQHVAAIDNAGNRLYYFNDFLGSSRLITDEMGKKLQKIDYSPFGQPLTGTDEDVLFTGKERDSTGLQYFGSRYYSADIGRFTQADPAMDTTASVYLYANGNPLKFYDPDGNAIDLAARKYHYTPVEYYQHPRLKNSRAVPDATAFIAANLQNWINEANEAGFQFERSASFRVEIRPVEGFPYDVKTNTAVIGALMDKRGEHGKWALDEQYTKFQVMRMYVRAFVESKRLSDVTGGKYLFPTDEFDSAGNYHNNLRRGIEDYYAYKLSGATPKAEYPDYFDLRKSITSRWNECYDIVSPILDNAGMPGIDWILSHPMSDEEKKQPSLYQQRAINELAQNTR